MRGTRAWRDGVGATSIKGVEDLIDALAGDSKTLSHSRGAATLFADCVDDGHVAVRAIHSVKHVATDE